jgi:hypothetical protein
MLAMKGQGITGYGLWIQYQEEHNAATIILYLNLIIVFVSASTELARFISEG